ncbi:MAG: helix-turn-helix domain-containing protein [Candidatus Omnitrophica bacterium]|nr:helix-turn-helix domain-containing protein [Candidatus Omnitrophota bacterium]MDD5430306.1 helix-turn-helix domain-containing protein [Candidatus Omnitrophota bacterium]
MKEKLLATREASHILGIPEKEIIALANNNIIPHFKVAGEFLRFRREDVLKIRPAIKKKYNIPEKQHRNLEKLREFIYFHDFYIVSTVIIVVLLWIIIKDIAFKA